MKLTAVLTDAAGNVSPPFERCIPVVDLPSGAFPTEYSLSRSLLQNNPGALVTGEDWQNFNTKQDVWNLGFFYHVSGTPLSQSQAVLLELNDLTFGKVVQCFNGDGTTNNPWTVSGGRSFSGIDKAWYRFTIKFQPGFTTRGAGGANSSWKAMFGGHRHIVYFNTTAYEAKFANYGGTESVLPNSDYQGGAAWHQVTTEWSDGEWWEFIIYEERLSPSNYRKRIWMRELTSGGSIVSLPSAASWLRTFGMETVNATVPAGDSDKIQLGINRNKPMFAGQSQYWFWGPWEVIDGDVLPDPYGIESQIK